MIGHENLGFTELMWKAPETYTAAEQEAWKDWQKKASNARPLDPKERAQIIARKAAEKQAQEAELYVTNPWLMAQVRDYQEAPKPFQDVSFPPALDRELQAVLGSSEYNWRDTVDKTLALSLWPQFEHPDSPDREVWNATVRDLVAVGYEPDSQKAIQTVGHDKLVRRVAESGIIYQNKNPFSSDMTAGNVSKFNQFLQRCVSYGQSLREMYRPQERPLAEPSAVSHPLKGGAIFSA